jgi:2-dehydropantoate 2-reductase
VVGYDAVVAGEVPAGPIYPCLPTDRLLADSRWLGLLRELMLEVIATANACGHTVGPDYADKEIERTRGMGSYRASTLIDFERGSPLELESLFVRPLEEARAAGVPVPRLEAVRRVLTGLAG